MEDAASAGVAGVESPATGEQPKNMAEEIERSALTTADKLDSGSVISQWNKASFGPSGFRREPTTTRCHRAKNVPVAHGSIRV
jgi:hypothetical protein